MAQGCAGLRGEALALSSAGVGGPMVCGLLAELERGGGGVCIEGSSALGLCVGALAPGCWLPAVCPATVLRALY